MIFRLVVCVALLLASAVSAENPTLLEARNMTSPIELTNTMNALMYATALLTVEKASMIYHGTGFFFVADVGPGQMLPLLITNRHVLEDGSSCQVRLHTQLKGKIQAENVEYLITDLQKSAVYHPDPDIDLAAIAMLPITNEIESKGKYPAIFYLKASELPPDGALEKLGPATDVLVVGYPAGYYDMTNNYPMFRKGITATHPAVDFNGAASFVVDCTTTPGSSGSPVILLREGAFTSEGALVLGGKEFMLLGIVYAELVYDDQGELVPVSPVNSAENLATQRFAFSAPTSLGLVVRSSEISNLAKRVLDGHSE